MKSGRIFQMLFIGACLVFSHRSMAQETSGPEPVWKTARRLMYSKDPASKDSLRALLPQLAGSNDETDMTWAMRGYYALGEKKMSDSINAVIPNRFPQGMMVRNKTENAIYEEKDVEKKVTIYEEWIKQFPPSKFLKEEHDHIIYDYARMNIAHAYAEKGDVKNAELWISQCEEDFYFGNSYGGLAEAFKKLNNIPMAEKYYKKAMLSAEKYYNDSLSKDNAVLFAGSGYPGLLNSYTDMLVRQKKYAEALPWAKKAMRLSKGPNPDRKSVV